jgi:hypothetical protein
MCLVDCSCTIVRDKLQAFYLTKIRSIDSVFIKDYDFSERQMFNSPKHCSSNKAKLPRSLSGQFTRVANVVQYEYGLVDI